MPQSMQSDPKSQWSYAEPSPPSSHTPSLGQAHVLSHNSFTHELMLKVPEIAIHAIKILAKLDFIFQYSV